ncbi:hypothetical protein BJV74DRAFT_109846 [Russula compacta]|nr:hypothetical protein BJV74DRAFT_109846 [Russula compacta]
MGGRMQAISWHLIHACDVGPKAMPIRRQMGKYSTVWVCVQERARARVYTPKRDVSSAAVPSMLQFLSMGGSHTHHTHPRAPPTTEESFAVLTPLCDTIREPAILLVCSHMVLTRRRRWGYAVTANPEVSRRKVHDDVALCAGRSSQTKRGSAPYIQQIWHVYTRDERRKVQER